MSREIHLALRFDAEWSPSSILTVNTLQTHQDVISQNGSTWWGKFGSGIADKKFNQIKNQIRNTKTYAFLFENAPFDKAYIAEITDILDCYPSSESNLIPQYYRIEAKNYQLFFKFKQFSLSQRHVLLKDLVLYNNPVKGSLQAGFAGASSLFYVAIPDYFKKELIHE